MKERLKNIWQTLSFGVGRHWGKIMLGVFVAVATYAMLVRPALGAVHRNQAQRSVPEVHTHTIDCRAALLNDDDSVVEQEICGYADLCDPHAYRRVL